MENNTLSFIHDLKILSSPEEIYQKIIEIGKTSPYKKIWNFSEQDRVLGCQSLLYVKLEVIDGQCHFSFHSDAIISLGLAALLIHFYQGRTPKEILTTPPIFLKELKLGHLLTPGRSNGVNSLYKKILELVVNQIK